MLLREQGQIKEEPYRQGICKMRGANFLADQQILRTRSVIYGSIVLAMIYLGTMSYLGWRERGESDVRGVQQAQEVYQDDSQQGWFDRLTKPFPEGTIGSNLGH